MRYLCRASRGAGECVNSMETVPDPKRYIGTRAVAGGDAAGCMLLARGRESREDAAEPRRRGSSDERLPWS